MLFHELKCLGDKLPYVVLVLLRVVYLVADVLYKSEVSLEVLLLTVFRSH